MDQPKIERVLRLMRLMSGSVHFSVDELAEKMDTSYRTIYRYIDTFKDAGFAVQKVYGNVYRILSMPDTMKDLDKLVYFSEEEAKIVAGMIQGLDGSNGLKGNLYRKLSAVYDITSIGHYTDNKKVAFNIEELQKAIQERRQVVLKNYASSHSGTAHDILVEPYDFTGEYINIWAFDVEKQQNRLYKIARIGKVETLETQWQSPELHRKGYVDAFRMTGHELTKVKLDLNLRAKNLLIEEFPLTESQITPTDHGTWLLETEVTHMEGIGRFVIGLAEDISIVDSPELTAYVRNYVSRFADKL